MNLNVHGLKNLGNSCYLNSILQVGGWTWTCTVTPRDPHSHSTRTCDLQRLQALASCESFIGQLEDAVEGADGQAMGVVLLDLLRTLQPRAAGGPPCKSLSPLPVLSALRASAGEETLPAGREHDVGEALELLAAALAADLQAAVARGCRSGAASHSPSLAALPRLRLRHEPLAGPDSGLHAWAACRGALEGSTAHEARCLRCGHQSGLQVTPFLSLALALPTAPGYDLVGNIPVARGASVVGSLRQHFSHELIPGVECTR